MITADELLRELVDNLAHPGSRLWANGYWYSLQERQRVSIIDKEWTDKAIAYVEEQGE